MESRKPFEGAEFNRATMFELSIFSLLAYQNKEYVEEFLATKGYPHVKFIENKSTCTQCYIAASDEDVIVFFTGTTDIKDILTDLEISKVPAPSGKKKEEVHKGFLTAQESIKEEIVYEIRMLQQEKHRRLWLTGHSLGAALAGIDGFDLQYNCGDIEVNGMYIFGCPRFSNVGFQHTFDTLLCEKTFRIVNNNDIVTRIPLISMGYRHIGTLYYFDSKGKLQKGISWWRSLRDLFKGKLEDVFNGEVDSIKDHDMALYSKLCLLNLQS